MSELEFWSKASGGQNAAGTGGHIVNPHQVNSGMLSVGDTVLVPTGTPHWFGIPGEPPVLLGNKNPSLPNP